MRLHSLAGASCPIARSIVAVGDWWSLLIVREIFLGAHRFSQIQRNLGLAKNILSARLKKLVENGVLQVCPVTGAHQSYMLTDQGADLQGVLESFAAWGERWLPVVSDPAAPALPRLPAAARPAGPGMSARPPGASAPM